MEYIWEKNRWRQTCGNGYLGEFIVITLSSQTPACSSTYKPMHNIVWRNFYGGCVYVWVSVRVKWQTTAIHERHVINIKSKENKYCLCKWLSYSVRWKRILDPFSLNEMQTSMIFWHFLCAIDVDYVYEIHATKRAGTNLSNISSVHMIRFRLANGRFTVFFLLFFPVCRRAAIIDFLKYCFVAAAVTVTGVDWSENRIRNMYQNTLCESIINTLEPQAQKTQRPDRMR